MRGDGVRDASVRKSYATLGKLLSRTS